MKTILINKTIKDELIIQKLSCEQTLFDIEFIDINTFIQRILKTDDNYFNISLKLQKLPLNDLKNTINDLAFIKLLLKDADEIMKNHIDINSLNINQEYILCLEAVIDDRYQLIDDYLNNNNFNEYEIYDNYYDLYQRKIIDKMLEKGAKLIGFPINNHQSYKNETNTMRDALGAIATYIIDNDLDLNDCVLIADNKYLKYTKIILNLYGIKLKTHPYLKSHKAIIFTSIIDFYLKRDIDSYLKIISSSFIKAEDIITLNEYFRRHVDELKLEEYTKFKDDDSVYYRNLEFKVNKINKPYFDILNQLLKLNFNEAIEYTFDLIADNDDESIKIKQIIEKYSDNLEDSYLIYREELLNLLINDNEDGLLVINYHEDIYFKDYIFVLNPDMNVYPGFKALNGFIKEKDLINTTYPTISSRYDNHLSLFKYLDYSKITIYFKIQSTFDGHSLEYDDIFDQLTDIKIDIINNENDKFLIYNHQLDPMNAHNIFIKNDEISGSVSSFEKYFKCPYSYFLNYGLSLYDPQLFDLNAALVGTMIHEIMEKVVKNNPSKYYLDYQNILDDTLAVYENKLLLMYPNEHGFIRSSILRVKEAINLEMEFIKDMEENNEYCATKMELRFDKIFLRHHNVDLRLRGIIDRVDAYVNEFRIIDYKTSVHSLSKTKIAKGLQLQLLTYALVYEQLSNDSANGIFYLNIKHEANKINEYKYSKTNGINEEIIDLESDFIKAHRLKGLFFKDDEKEYQHIVTNKKIGIKTDYLINHQNTIALITEIYQYLIDNLMSGNIRLMPDNDACEYCNYHRICHFNGVKGLNPIISEISLGGKDND